MRAAELSEARAGAYSVCHDPLFRNPMNSLEFDPE
jgi:hypothetical protein